MARIAGVLLLIIRCPSCETCYDIAAQSVGDEGRLVECARCKHRWTATAEEPASAEPADISDGFDTPQFDAGTAADEFGQSDIDVSGLQDADPFEGLDDTELYDDEPERKVTSGVAMRTRKRIVVKRKTSTNSPPMQVFMLLVTIGIVGLGAWLREPIVRSVPHTAVLYELVGLPVNLTRLEFQDLIVSQEVENRSDILIVRGRIANVSDEVVMVPALRITLRSADSQELFSWDKNLEFETLAPGSSAEFRTTLASPPPEAKDLTVRFVPRTQETVELRP